MLDTVFGFIAILCAVGGLAMVGGGIFLLYKGILTLPTSSDVAALSIEAKNALKDFKVSTTTPALAFFIIGLAFIVIPLMAVKPAAPELTVVGTISEKTPGMTISIVQPWDFPGTPTTGQFSSVIRPSHGNLMVFIRSPGHDEVQRPVNINQVEAGKIDLGEIELKEKTPRDQITTAVVPVSEPLPPLDLSPRVGQGGSNVQAY